MDSLNKLEGCKILHSIEKTLIELNTIIKGSENFTAFRIQVYKESSFKKIKEELPELFRIKNLYALYYEIDFLLNKLQSSNDRKRFKTISDLLRYLHFRGNHLNYYHIQQMKRRVKKIKSFKNRPARFKRQH